MTIAPEIVEKAWQAFRDSDKPAPYNQIKDALLAVLPDIQRAERERCARVADAQAWSHGLPLGAEQNSVRIASTIRELKDQP